MELYVGNLSKQTTKEELQQEFEKYGQVLQIKFKINLFTKEPKGYAFVSMPNEAEAQKAIEKLNNKKLHGKEMLIKEAKSQEKDWNKGGKRGMPF